MLSTNNGTSTVVECDGVHIDSTLRVHADHVSRFTVPSDDNIAYANIFYQLPSTRYSNQRAMTGTFSSSCLNSEDDLEALRLYCPVDYLILIEKPRGLICHNQIETVVFKCATIRFGVADIEELYGDFEVVSHCATMDNREQVVFVAFVKDETALGGHMCVIRIPTFGGNPSILFTHLGRMQTFFRPT